MRFFGLKILFNVNGKAAVWHTPCFSFATTLMTKDLKKTGRNAKPLGRLHFLRLIGGTHMA
jgi:hypothetical protein